jgi:hypothetical protein
MNRTSIVFFLFSHCGESPVTFMVHAGIGFFRHRLVPQRFPPSALSITLSSLCPWTLRKSARGSASASSCVPHGSALTKMHCKPTATHIFRVITDIYEIYPLKPETNSCKGIRQWGEAIKAQLHVMFTTCEIRYNCKENRHMSVFLLYSRSVEKSKRIPMKAIYQWNNGSMKLSAAELPAFISMICPTISKRCITLPLIPHRLENN